MASSPWLKCAEGIKSNFETPFSTIAISGISAIPAASILIRSRDLMFSGIKDALPAIVLAPANDIEREATVNQDDTGHGVLVAIVKASNRSPSTDLDELGYWRELAFETIRQNRRIASAGVHYTAIEPRQVIDPAAWSRMYDLSQFVARCWVRSEV